MHKLMIAISAALLLAVATSAASAASSHASTANAAVAPVCSELPPLYQAARCADGPHCLEFGINDRTVGPTFPTTCRQTT